MLRRVVGGWPGTERFVSLHSFVTGLVCRDGVDPAVRVVPGGCVTWPVPAGPRRCRATVAAGGGPCATGRSSLLYRDGNATRWPRDGEHEHPSPADTALIVDTRPVVQRQLS